MKKILLAAVIFLLQFSTVSATVEKHTDNRTNFEMSYPIVYTKNLAAQNKINQDIYHYIAAFRDFRQVARERILSDGSKDYDNGTFNYEVKYEDDKFVSLVIGEWRYRLENEHGIASYSGLVYDKNTGNRLPLKYFLKVTSQDLRRYATNNAYWNEIPSEKEIKIKPMDWWNAEVPEDYFLVGNGGVVVFYQPYLFTSGMSGISMIKFSASEVDYLNRKNRGL